MAKLRIYRGLLMCMIFGVMNMSARGQYHLKIFAIDKDSSSLQKLGLQNDFKDRVTCLQYVARLPATLRSKGYSTVSIDSVHYDSTYAEAWLFVGEPFTLAYIKTDPEDRRILELSGWNERSLYNKALNTEQLQMMQEKMLDYLENNGYPFAKIQLDSVSFEGEKMYGVLKIEEGPLYKIDSIRVIGNAKISSNFLQRYLDIPNGSIYQKKKLQDVGRRLLELPYLQEQQNLTMTMLGTGSIVNLYLQPKKSSQVNVLVGLLPANEQTADNKMLVTGEANINLRNALGSGETIGVNWQQIQVKSPRLNLAFQQPYLFGSPFGVSTSFDLLKKDSSYVNLNLLLGVQYTVSTNQTGKVFVQMFRTNLLSVDTPAIKSSKQLPPQIDVSTVNVGVDYTINKTDYRFNPRSGYELQTEISAGTRKIRKNNVIVQLHDPSFSFNALYDTVKLSAYQFKILLKGAKYFRLAQQSVLKTAINVAWLESPSIYRNELFQIGGYKLLRGFDEESIFASQYGVASVEYRYLLGLNSFMFAFADGGLTSNKSNNKTVSTNYLGFGLGLAFETKAGIFNLSYAAGKRSDTKFDLRQSKIHLGYINYF